MNVSTKIIKAGFILFVVTLLSACGGFNEGDKVMIDFGEGNNTLEGYATGTIMAIDDDMSVIKFIDVSARTKKIDMASLDTGIGQVPVKLLREYESGIKSYEIRHLIERTMISLLDEHNINKIAEQTQQLIGLLNNQDFPEGDELVAVLEMAHDYYKKIQLEALSDKKLILHSQLVNDVYDFVQADENVFEQYKNYLGSFDKVVGFQFDLQVQLEARKYGGGRQAVLAALQKFVGYPALFSGKYVKTYAEYRDSLIHHARKDKEASVRVYNVMNDTERRYFQAAGQYTNIASALPKVEDNWVNEQRNKLAAAMIKDDVAKILSKVAQTKYPTVIAAEKAYAETKLTLEKKIESLGIAVNGDVLTAAEKEALFVGPTKKRLAKEAAEKERQRKREAAEKARLKKLDAIAEKQISWFEKKLIKFRKHYGRTQVSSSYSFELIIDKYDRKKRTFTGVINYTTHNGYFAGKNRFKGWFEKEGANAHLIIKETSAIKKRRQNPIEPVNTFGFRIKNNWENEFRGERQINGHTQGWAKLYVRKK